MDEIECARGDVVGDKVELGDFTTEAGQVGEVAWVGIDREYSTAGQHSATQPSRE